MRHGHHSRRQSLAVSSRSGVLGSPPLGAPVGSRRETTPFSDRDPVVRQSQPTIILCLLLWSSGSSVTANDRSVSAITAKWFVSHSQQSFCHYGQMVRHSQPTIVLCLLLWPNGSSLTANNSYVSVIMVKWFVSHSQRQDMHQWFVSHSQRSLCVCYYGQMVRHSQPTIVLCLLLWPNGSSVAANNSSVYYYGQMVHLSQPMILVCRS